MDSDIEKLRQELKDKVDEMINAYIAENNTIIEIPEENIYMSIDLDGQKYVVFTEDSKDTEEMDMMFAKVNIIEGKRILRNIENKEEYDKVVDEFNRRLEIVGR